jgi:hypothetical protein
MYDAAVMAALMCSRAVLPLEYGYSLPWAANKKLTGHREADYSSSDNQHITSLG